MSKLGKLGFVCCLVYFVSYITRINYGTAVAEIARDLQVGKELAGLGVTGSFVTYGLGQIISGFLGDKFKPRKLIVLGLLGTSVINLAVVFLTDIYAMSAVWCFNGFFQSLMWPPLVRIMAENMDEDMYAISVRNVTAAASVATVAIYVIVPVCISIYSWRLAFLFSSLCGVLTAAVWFKLTKGIKETSSRFTDSEDKAFSFRTGKIFIMLSVLAIAIALQGMLRDGITTWMPSYITEVYGTDVSLSTLTTAILPIFSILSISFAAFLDKRIHNPVKTAALLFAVGAVSCGILAPVYKTSMFLSVVFIALITACMHGVNLMLIGRIPAYFGRYGKASTVSGALNSCVYIGSALSTYGFAAFSESYGWGATVIGWTVIAAIGTLATVLSIRKWNNFVK